MNLFKTSKKIFIGGVLRSPDDRNEGRFNSDKSIKDMPSCVTKLSQTKAEKIAQTKAENKAKKKATQDAKDIAEVTHDSSHNFLDGEDNLEDTSGEVKTL